MSAADGLCLTCGKNQLILSSNRGTVAKWILEQGRTSAIPPNAPGPQHRNFSPHDAHVRVFIAVDGNEMPPNTKVLWWGATPRTVASSPKPVGAAKAYNGYTNCGIDQIICQDNVAGNCGLTIYAHAPQPYYEEGRLWPPHFHFCLANPDGKTWGRKVYTIAGYPGHHADFDYYMDTMCCSTKSSYLTPHQVKRNKFILTLVNALPKQYGNVPLDGAKHMHVPYDAPESEIKKAAASLGHTPYVVYCEKPSCDAGARLIKRLVGAGATNVFYMPEGRQGWPYKS